MENQLIVTENRLKNIISLYLGYKVVGNIGSFIGSLIPLDLILTTENAEQYYKITFKTIGFIVGASIGSYFGYKYGWTLMVNTIKKIPV